MFSRNYLKNMKNKKIKICFVIVNRANYGRIKILLQKLNKNSKFKLQIILCSSALLNKYGELNKILMKDGLKIDFKIYSNIEGENLISMTKTAGHLISDLTTCLSHLKPDMVVTVGDRFETIATAISASYLNKFLVHIQGGELSGSIDESIRHAVTKFSHLHLVATKSSKTNVIQLGENPKNVHNVGCPSIDEILNISLKKKVNLSNSLYGGGTGNLVNLDKDYIVCLAHPDTRIEEENKVLINSMIKAIIKIKMQTIILWPNIDAGSNLISRAMRVLQQSIQKKVPINFYKNFSNDDYYRILKMSKCLVGNSSSGIRECSFLGVPVVNIGKRQDYRERGKNVVDVKPVEEEITKAIKFQIKKTYKKQNIYGDGKSSDKIIHILANTKIDIIKRFYKRT